MENIVVGSLSITAAAALKLEGSPNRRLGLGSAVSVRAAWIAGSGAPTLACGMAGAAAGSPQLVGKLPSWQDRCLRARRPRVTQSVDQKASAAASATNAWLSAFQEALT